MDSASPFQPWATDDSAKNVKTEKELVDDAKLHRENVNHPKHRQTASYNKESIAVASNAPGSSSSTAPGGEPARGNESNMDSSKIASMQQIVENTLSQEGRQRVAQLLEAVEALSGAERLLLYLRLPTGVPQHDPLKQPINPLGSRAELQQTVTWIQTHLEVDPDVSLPKQDVYDEYIAHCMSSNMKPLSTADFGKVMKQVYPTVRPRRLGTRGNSRYCYAGLRKKIKLEVPQLPDLGEASKEPTAASRETERIVCDWAETKLGMKFASISELSRHLVAASTQHAAPGPASASPPPLAQTHAPAEDATSRQLIKHLKRKIQTQGTPGRPKKNKGQEVSGESPPSTSYAGHHQPMKHESEPMPDMSYYPAQPPYVPVRSKSTAAALAREEQEAASPTRSVKAPTSKSEMLRNKLRKSSGRASGPSPDRAGSPERTATPDSCCGLDGINIKTGMICEEKHSEILNRERVISICNIDKHDLDDYLNEGNSQEHEEELLQYFHHRANQAQTQANASTSDSTAAFLERGQDPHDEHSQGKNEKISQLRELLAKNLKNQSGSSSQTMQISQETQLSQDNSHEPPPIKTTISEGAFKPLTANEPDMNGPTMINQSALNTNKHNNSVPNQNGTSLSYINDTSSNQVVGNVGGPHLYNGHCHNEPQSPTTRTQQYEFVPISDGCHSPGNFHSKSPLGFGQRGQSPTKVNKQIIMGGSLQTSPISHSTAASPFVSPRNTPVPRSRLCPRPIPKHNGRKRRNPLSLGVADPCSKQFAIPNDQKFMSKATVCGPGKYCQPISAPPSPNILTQYKNHNMYACPSGMSNGSNNLCLNFLPNAPFRDHVNGDQPLSADPLSSEVSQFFQESLVTYRSGPDTFRSQSVPLKQGIGNMGLLSYNNTPVGSVPPTPVPNEFCDFGSLADTCDISKAGLNRETLDKIYDAIDSSNDVLTTNATQNILSTNDTLSNGCDPLPEHQILSDEQLTSIIPSGEDLLERSNQFSQSFTNDSAAADNVEDFLKRANSIEFDLSELVTEKNKYYNTSRSVPSTPLPYKRTAPNLQIDSRRSRELFTAENYSNVSNGISSKSVPSTPQFAEDRSVFSYSNRDFLINGNSVCGSSQIHEPVVDSEGLTSPLHDMLREDILGEPLTPALLADLDKMDATPYVDL
uniref:RFX-type winged-helix domain-containing protein n=1 Tax=Heliothis virescens TaxID=7102 RepID=A0A2A4K7J6_HELVI